MREMNSQQQNEQEQTQNNYGIPNDAVTHEHEGHLDDIYGHGSPDNDHDPLTDYEDVEAVERTTVPTYTPEGR